MPPYDDDDGPVPPVVSNGTGVGIGKWITVTNGSLASMCRNGISGVAFPRRVEAGVPFQAFYGRLPRLRDFGAKKESSLP
mmetsp:Transcript_4321/g.11182  ORF Transcript_4321/g.11182 Transcript_4321/m.11182 type:complete len:80 (-) Transcript_4321:445-684(-)